MFILGINAYHADSSACILKNNKILAAAEEERFNRVKHWNGFPIESIRYCLNEANISFDKIDHVAINSNSLSNITKKIFYSFKNILGNELILDRLLKKSKKNNLLKDLNFFFGSKSKFRIHFIDHHLSHIASSYLLSGFKESVIISVDGFGDFASASYGFAKNENFRIEKQILFPHSLGIFYQAITQFLGFPNYGDEYKVMGLAPYGKTTFMKQMNSILNFDEDNFKLNLEYFNHQKNKIDFISSEGSPIFNNIFNKKFENLFNIPQRKKNEQLSEVHFDIARSAQKMYEDVLFSILNYNFSKYQINKLCLSGGCAMNSVANGKIYRNTPYKSLYIPASSGDAGGAIGAALIVSQRNNKIKINTYSKNAYLGPSYSNLYIENLLSENNQSILEAGCEIVFLNNISEICIFTANSISNGKVIGWFQDRMEWGPRSLGNRSILCDPRLKNMKEILNQKIKKRESFRPFAPSVLREEVCNWFEEDDDVPFMMQVFQIKKKLRNRIPAVTHVDGSGRLQTVHKETNPKFYMLINEFKKITGIPILLNTSFNENEPVVCDPQHALNTFLRTKMDILVIGNYIIKRK